MYYGYWKPIYLLLIVASILFNYGIGTYLAKGSYRRKTVLAAGVAANLSTLGYFKYANFFAENLNRVLPPDEFHFDLPDIVLPLAISFFTFQQIAFLVDAYRRETSEYNFLNYSLFVTFFPQLIAGPIVHHKEMMPQFADDKSSRLNWDSFAMGISAFSIGLFKKVGIADTAARYATPMFEKAEALTGPGTLTFFEAWGGTLSYAFQIYFDFSGYSDMAIGLGLMVGIQLPINFNSPYRSVNIIEFWRRWHMTLSRFLRDYLYFPMGGNRKGRNRRYTNLMITMFLGGLWHGASWNFVLWGGLHGLFLVINHVWRGSPFGRSRKEGRGSFYTAGCIALTFAATTLAWVFFRAPTLSGAMSVYAAMLGLNGVSFSDAFVEAARSGTLTLIDFQQPLLLLGMCFITFLPPNLMQLLHLFNSSPSRAWRWTEFKPNVR